ncbi:UTRA domain-containing protein [Kitasatospora gansuensis]
MGPLDGRGARRPLESLIRRPADAAEREQLRLEPGTEVYVTLRLRTLSGTPVMVERTVYPPLVGELVAQLPRTWSPTPSPCANTASSSPTPTTPSTWSPPTPTTPASSPAAAAAPPPREAPHHRPHRHPRRVVPGPLPPRHGGVLHPQLPGLLRPFAARTRKRLGRCSGIYGQGLGELRRRPQKGDRGVGGQALSPVTRTPDLLAVPRAPGP